MNSKRFSDWVFLGPDSNVRIEGTIALTLPSRRKVEVKRRLMGFEKWNGATPELPRIWSSKGYLDYHGKPLFAELVILRMLESEGWEGVWVNNFGGEFLKSLPKCSNPVLSPESRRKTFERVVHRNGGSRRGCWDVFAWRGSEVLFAEAKRNGKDHLRESQRAWVEAALAARIPLSSFLVVEWQLM